MPYPDNKIYWPADKIVLHKADAKHPKMYMRVIGYTRDGLCKTQYVNLLQMRKIWTNPISELLDPEDFGLRGTEDPDEYEQMRIWNYYHPVGIAVITISEDGGFIGRTSGPAYLSDSGSACVPLKDRGVWLLQFVIAY
jgi:hypothetical protein